MKYASWVVYCKTPNCDGIRGFQFIGEYDGSPVRLLPVVPEAFDYECPKCGKVHRYTVGDLKFQVHDSPPQPKPPKA
jgi:hypothetical protein